MRLEHKGCQGYETAISFDQLLSSSYECSRNVKWKSSVLNWMFEKESRCAKLSRELTSGEYRIRPYLYFNLKGPKPRLISSTKFRDSVVQRSLCDNGLYDMISRPLIYDNGACLVGKGIQFVFKRFIVKLRKYLSHHTTGYVVKCDVRHFFDDTPHEELKKTIRKHITDNEMFRHVCMIIDSFKDMRTERQISEDMFGRRGMGLGSQISQLLMLLYLNDIDHFLCQNLNLKTYVRYMDDMIAICETVDQAKTVLSTISDMLQKKGLRLNDKSTIVKIGETGNFEFLKVRIHTKNQKVRFQMSRKAISREVNKIRKMFAKGICLKTICDQYNSWFGSNEYKMSKGQKRYANSKFKTYYSKHGKHHEDNIQEDL